MLRDVYIKIFGIQRTSTTYTVRLVKTNTNNCHVFNNELGHKHSVAKKEVGVKKWLDKRADDLGKDGPKYKKVVAVKDDLFVNGKKVHPLIVIKNPYSWYKSISRWAPPTYNKDFDIETWYNRYNHLYTKWKELLENPHSPFGSGRVVNYEETLKDPNELILYTRDNYNTKLKDKLDIPNKVASSSTFDEKRRDFYLREDNFGLSDELTEKITSLVDWDLMEFYNYKPFIKG